VGKWTDMGRVAPAPHGANCTETCILHAFSQTEELWDPFAVQRTCQWRHSSTSSPSHAYPLVFLSELSDGSTICWCGCLCLAVTNILRPTPLRSLATSHAPLPRWKIVIGETERDTRRGLVGNIWPIFSGSVFLRWWNEWRPPMSCSFRDMYMYLLCFVV